MKERKLSDSLNIAVLYVGSSLLAPLKQAEREINRARKFAVQVSAFNLGAPLSSSDWNNIERDLSEADVVFVIHVTDSENAARLLSLLRIHAERHHAVIVINCMPELMRSTRMGKLDLAQLISPPKGGEAAAEKRAGGSRVLHLLAAVGTWVSRQAENRKTDKPKRQSHGQYLKFVDRLPALLRLVPPAGTLRDIRNYLHLFCYFLQPTPANIQAMLLFALKHYVPDARLKRLRIEAPEHLPAVAIYHPNATQLFESFAEYEKWWRKANQKNGTGEQNGAASTSLDPATTIGLLLLRPQVVSRATKHYDALIRSIEAQDLNVIPVMTTLMDNREACQKFFRCDAEKPKSSLNEGAASWRISQLVSLTGFSFVGGPAMNDSEAAATFLRQLNRPYRSVVSLDMQTIESWSDSPVGLNPVQAGMQVAIPEIDGATEPFVYGGIPAAGVEPIGLEDRCDRLARRLKRWHRLQTAERKDLKLAFVLFCFPPNKGNIGTAADLDVFPSLWQTLRKLQAEGYAVTLPAAADDLRNQLLGGNSEAFGASTNIAYRMSADEYRRLCPYVSEIEQMWGGAPGAIDSFGKDLLIQGISLGNIFLGVQPTFGFEGDPMRLLMARGSTPHHGFMAFYTYLCRVLNADAVVHVGTHGALEFMPGKQIGLSGDCWPDRLIGELPNVYLYSVNNPSEGSIAKRRSYAELISYLTPPIENAGLYKELASLKELVLAYRDTADDAERKRLFGSIEDCCEILNLSDLNAQSTSSNAAVWG